MWKQSKQLKIHCCTPADLSGFCKPFFLISNTRKRPEIYHMANPRLSCVPHQLSVKSDRHILPAICQDVLHYKHQQELQVLCCETSKKLWRTENKHEYKNKAVQSQSNRVVSKTRIIVLTKLSSNGEGENRPVDIKTLLCFCQNNHLKPRETL